MGQRHRWYTWGLMAAALFVWVSASSGASQRAHVHGVGRINIVVEGQQATVEFLAPAEGLYGFEHQARTPAEQEKRDAALARLQEQISSMVVFEAERGCQFATQKIAVETDVEGKHEQGKSTEKAQKKSGEHSEVHAKFTVTCKQPLAGSQVRFGVSKVFPAIKTVHVQVLSDARQAGVEVKSDKGRLRL
jgi:Protein of unknown function (DUF2796)